MSALQCDRPENAIIDCYNAACDLLDESGTALKDFGDLFGDGAEQVSGCSENESQCFKTAVDIQHALCTVLCMTLKSRRHLVEALSGCYAKEAFTNRRVEALTPVKSEQDSANDLPDDIAVLRWVQEVCDILANYKTKCDPLLRQVRVRAALHERLYRDSSSCGYFGNRFRQWADMWVEQNKPWVPDAGGHGHNDLSIFVDKAIVSDAVLFRRMG